MEVGGDGYWTMVKEYQVCGCPRYYWVWCGRNDMNEEIDISDDGSEISYEEESESTDEEKENLNEEAERLEMSRDGNHNLNDEVDSDDEIEEVN